LTLGAGRYVTGGSCPETAAKFHLSFPPFTPRQLADL
jgi:hypothetical protein